MISEARIQFLQGQVSALQDTVVFLAHAADPVVRNAVLEAVRNHGMRIHPDDSHPSFLDGYEGTLSGVCREVEEPSSDRK